MAGEVVAACVQRVLVDGCGDDAVDATGQCMCGGSFNGATGQTTCIGYVAVAEAADRFEVTGEFTDIIGADEQV